MWAERARCTRSLCDRACTLRGLVSAAAFERPGGGRMGKGHEAARRAAAATDRPRLQPRAGAS